MTYQVVRVRKGKLSWLFEEDPIDIVKIRNNLRNARPEDFEDKYLEVVAWAKKKDKSLDHDQIFRNAIILAAYLKVKGLNTSQLRKFLELANRANLKFRNKLDIKADILKMQCILAYSTRNDGKDLHGPINSLVAVLSPLLQTIGEKNFEKFYEFLQAVVAYHRFFGGRER
ncbi:type III-A CRISPR-associated protein Csm2 [Thermococcus sp. LS2]|uniref:type III-A CRISPR-associated protein Csm2 n=1 Tax=Thermococcus sp. LS2 TaxID=1638260 RepID=UPI00143A4C3D|nr:type III-A CRISPR-associated protein Csm2 [Thermococcus sp. LS2]NJE13345.1 type III-A CRISPR-associated protein Csm2 [Thermococcus sp. LS2]